MIEADHNVEDGFGGLDSLLCIGQGSLRVEMGWPMPPFCWAQQLWLACWFLSRQVEPGAKGEIKGAQLIWVEGADN